MPKASLSFLSGDGVLHWLEPGLRDLIKEFQSRLHLPDPGHVLTSLATYAAFLGSAETPLWLMTIGGPSTGKTEGVGSLRECPLVHEVSELTKPGLLSASRKRERTADSTGGLLREIGDRGFLALKDFTSILSMGRDARQELLSALREIYDGRWSRKVGPDGGVTLAWEGRIGLLAGVTSAIDEHFEVMNKLGERFIYYRLPKMSVEEQMNQAESAVDSTEEAFRILAPLVKEFFSKLPIANSSPPTAGEKDFLTALATLVVRCRSSVSRDGKDRTIDLIHAAESPPRLTKQLKLLLAALKGIGVGAPYCHQLVRKVALDSMPPTRRQVLSALGNKNWAVTLEDLRKSLGLSRPMIYRALEELQAHEVVFSKPAVDQATESNKEAAPDKKAFVWGLRPRFRELWERSKIVSEMSDGAAHALAGD